MQFNCGTDQAGHSMCLIQTQEVIDALPILRALKQAFPQLWQQVNLEISVPQNGVNRLIGVDGK